MTAERWAKVERLYHAALARAAAERPAFLLEVCADEPDLRREVEALLASPASAEGFLGSPAIAMAARMVSATAASVLTGRRLGVYHLQERIGAGGMGEVYRARDTKLGRDVAIKILPREFTTDADRLSRFEREARVLAALNHPNIGAIYGFEDAEVSGPADAGHDARPRVRGLVLELVDGETIADRVRRGPVPLGEALAIARQIADALHAAHEKGIVHRDLKPANLKITPGGVVKVLDFGLAKAASGDGTGADSRTPTLTIGATHEGIILGTAAYMSPEQARGLPVDKRTDIWAFGCVLFEMLTGQAAFAGETISDTIAAILDREPDWSSLAASTPPVVRRLLRRCLAKDLKPRLHDIADARIEIDEAMGDSPAPESAPAPARSSRRAMYLGGATILGLVIAVVWWQSGTPQRVPENPLASASFQRLTRFEGSELDASISPDGRFVVFVSNREGPYDAWVTQVGTGAFANVTKGMFPYILNDEIRNVGFTADNEVVLVTEPPDATGRVARTETYVLPLTGGSMRRFHDRGVETVWSADGNRVGYHESGPGDPIFVADRNGRDARQIFIGAAGIHSHYLSWSPDGRFIYFVHGVPPNEMDIWRVPSEGGTPERVTFHNGDVAYPAFIDNRTLIYRATADDGSGPWLYAVDVERSQPYRVSLGVEQYLSVAAAAGGRRLVATVSNPASGLWTVPITDGVADEQSATPMTLPNVRALSPRFGADSVWYLSSDGGVNGLWRFRDGTAHEIWKPGEGGLAAPPALSADGQLISFLAKRQGRTRLYVMNTDGTNARALAESLELRDAPTWSPDGTWIGVATGDRLLKVPVDGGSPVPLVEGPARIPIWSPDGRFILYSESIQGGPAYPVKAVTPEGAPFPMPDFSVRRSGDRYRVMPNGRQVVFLVGDYGRQNFWLVDFESGARRKLTNLRPGLSIQGFDISADGSRILFDRVRENSDVVLIDLPPASTSRGILN